MWAKGAKRNVTSACNWHVCHIGPGCKWESMEIPQCIELLKYANLVKICFLLDFRVIIRRIIGITILRALKKCAKIGHIN